MARPESLQTTFSPSAASASMPCFQRVELLGGIRAGPTGVLHDDGQVAEAGELVGSGAEEVGVGHQLEGEAALLECLEHGRIGDGMAQRSHGPHAAETGRGHLAIEQVHGVGHGFGGRQAADDGVGSAVGVRRPVELDGLLDRVGPGGGGHVDELLDVPLRRLGPVGLHVEAPVHPGGVAGPPMRRCHGEVGVPALVGRVPQVDVGVDDPGGLVRHQASLVARAPVALTISRRLSSSQSGMVGPP